MTEPPGTRVPPHELPASLREAGLTNWIREPLDDADCRTLVANLLGRGPLPSDAAGRIAGAADGNALFAEELLAMLVDDDLLRWDGARWVAAEGLLAVPVPTTFHSLLAARLEGLPSDERALLVLASVEGETFHRSGIRELAGARRALGF